MDLFSIDPFYFIVFSISLSILFLLYQRKSAIAELPPGKRGLPMIGETVDFFLASKKGNPKRFILDRMRKYSPEIFRTSLMGEDIAVLCGAMGNKFHFSNDNKLLATWWPECMKKVVLFPTLDNSSKEEFVKMHGFLPEFLKPESLLRYVPMMDSMARQHVDMYWSSNTEVKGLTLSKKYTFALACRLFMSIEDPEQIVRISDPLHLITAGLVSLPVDLPGTAFNRAIKGGIAIREELAKVIKKRKMELEENKVPPQDLLSRLLLNSDGNGRFMNEKEINCYMIGMLIASYDTASTAITFTLNYLAEFPDVYNQVLTEQMEIAKTKGPDELLTWDDLNKMKYTWNVANESLRLAPPSHGAFREVKTEFTFAGFKIPKGWKTYWTVNSTHKNPEYFPNPEKFDPSRFEGKGPAPFTFVPFGGGPRTCPGKEFARLEILAFMYNIVTKFRLEKANPKEKITYTPTPVPVNGLPLRIYPHEK